MKEVKKVLGAALAATLTTGIVGTVAGATTVDDLYKAAYDATVNALNKKDQDSINVAREAINKLPAELQGFKGEFSKQVDTVQHPILVTIVDAINNADKTLKQVDINAARKAIPANLPTEWRNSYSTGVDAAQQKLIAKVVEAADKAVKVGSKANVDAVRTMLKEIATVENNEGVKAWVATYADDFLGRVALDVDSVDVTGINTVRVNFVKEVDANTVTTKSFTAYETESEKALLVSAVKVSEDKMSVEVKFADIFAVEKVSTIEVKNIKDLNGKVMSDSKGEFEYVKSEVGSVELAKTNVTPTVGTTTVKTELSKFVVVKDDSGRDITKTSTIKFKTSDLTIVDENGQVQKKGQALVSVVVMSEGKEVLTSKTYMVNIDDSTSTESQGLTVYTDATTVAGKTFDKVEKKTDSVKLGSTNSMLALFFEDQFGKAQNAVIGNDIEVIKNLNPEIAVLKTEADNITATGEIRPVSQGTASFKVRVKGTKTEVVVSINVKAEAKVGSLNLDKTSVSLVEDTAIAQEVKVDVKDQFGDAFGAGTLEVKVKNEKGEYVAVTSAKYSTLTVAGLGTNGAVEADGKASLSFVAKTEVGSDNYRVTYTFTDVNAKKTTLTKDLSVAVKAKGDFSGYQVDGKVTSLELNDVNPSDGNSFEGSFNLYEVDNKGNAISEVTTGATISIVDTDKVLVGDNDTNTADKANFTVDYVAGKYVITAVNSGNDKAKVGDYKVTVTVGTHEVTSYVLTVKDSARTAKVVTFDEVVIKEADLTVDKVISSIVTVKDQYGNVVDFTDANSKVVVKESVKTNVTADGSYDLSIKKVAVTIANGNTVDIEFSTAKVVKVIQ